MVDGTQLFVTWQDSRRSASLADRRGLRRCVFVAHRSGVPRHVFGALRTIALLARERPREVWYQYSFVLGLVLSGYRRLCGRACSHLIADVHSKALRRDGGRVARAVVLPLKRWSLRACTAVLVTNPENRQFAERRLRVRAFVLPDPLPNAPLSAAHAASVSFNPSRHAGPVVFVCSFAWDEPIELMEATSRLLPRDIAIAFTGDSRALSRATRGRLAALGRLTGFLSDPEYWQLLRAAGAIVVLTTEPACLPCGAYEAIAVGRRPVLLADERARAVFRELAIFAAPEPASVAQAIATARGPAGRLGPTSISAYERRWRSWWNALPAWIRTRPPEGAAVRQWGRFDRGGSKSRAST